MEQALRKVFDSLLTEMKTLLSTLNPVEGLAAELLKHGVLSEEEKAEIERVHNEERERNERAAGIVLLKIVEKKRDVDTLQGLIAAQDSFCRFYDQCLLPRGPSMLL